MAAYPDLIMIIVIDTLRYDYSIPLKRLLLKEGFIEYDNVIAPSSWTAPSHASLFSGLYPAFHGVHEKKNRKIEKVFFRPELNRLRIWLRKLGYKAYLFSANPFISPTFGYRGFDHSYYFIYSIKQDFLINRDEREIIKRLRTERNYSRLELILHLIKAKKLNLVSRAVLNKILNEIYYWYRISIKKYPLNKGSDVILGRVIKALLKNEHKHKFVFINLMEVHEPYSLNESTLKDTAVNLLEDKLDPRVVERWRRLYPKEVEYIAGVLKNFLDKVNSLSIRKPLIIITSDHGQLLGEYNRIGHGTFLYDELLRVPLFIKFPEDIDVDADMVKRNSYGRYFSLKDLMRLILGIIKGDKNFVNNPYVDTVYAESYGLIYDFSKYLNKEDLRRIEKLYERYKVAVYSNNVMGIFDIPSWSFEYLKSFEEKEVNDIKRQILKNKVIKFLKEATAISKSISLARKLRS